MAVAESVVSITQPKHLSVHDLRSFLDIIRNERPRDLVDVKRSVNPKYETTAILTLLERSYRFPILCFHSVEGSAYPAVTNVCGSASRLAIAMQCTLADLAGVYADRISHPIKPSITAAAPVHERILTGDDVDLHPLPQFIYHENDSCAPYITAAIVVARDPETQKSNLSFHRLMLVDRATTTIYIAPGKHLDSIFRKFESAGEPMPIVAFIGSHPLWCLGALYSGPAEVEEYDIIGGLQQTPLELVNCVTNNLQVPARAEFALEGVVWPSKRASEGPFGEFTGYSTGNMRCPVFSIRAITSRSDPIFQDIVSGHSEHRLLPLLGMEHHLLQLARAVAPNVTAVRMPLPLTACVALNKRDDSEPKRIIDALASQDIYMKQVVIVDSDVDVSDIRQVTTAAVLHVRPDRDIYILPPSPCTELDPASDGAATAAKFGIDATMAHPNSRPIAKNSVPKHVLDTLKLSDFLPTR